MEGMSVDSNPLVEKEKYDKIRNKAEWTPYIETLTTFFDATGAALTTAALSWSNQENKDPSSDETIHKNILDNAIVVGAIGGFCLIGSSFLGNVAKDYATKCSIYGKIYHDSTPLHDVHVEWYDSYYDCANFGRFIFGTTAAVFGGLTGYSLSDNSSINYKTAIIFPSLAAFFTVLSKSVNEYYVSPPSRKKENATDEK